MLSDKIRNLPGEPSDRRVPGALGCPRPPKHIAPYISRALRRRPESLASFRFPKPLHKRALTQALQSAVKIMPGVTQRLVQLSADFPQVQAFEIKQLKGHALAVRQFVKGFLKLYTIQFCTYLAVQVGFSQQCIAKRARVCTKVKSPACEMGSPVKRAMQRDLDDPILYRAFCTII